MAPLTLRRRGRGPRVRAVVLAAGYGTRLAPLTDTVPKPLLPVRGTTLVELTLERLARAGCEAVALNLHHLGDAIRDRLGESYRGLPLAYSEEPEIRGTLGALAPLRSFFAGCESVVVVNGDSLCRWPIARLLRHHRRRGAAATLLFAARADPARFGGGVAVDRAGRVVSFRPPHAEAEAGPDAGPNRRAAIRRLVFAGAYVLAPELLARAPERFSHVVHDLWEPLLAEGAHLEAVVTRSPWYDLGTPRRYRDAATEGGATPRAIRWLGRTRVAEDARVERSARLRRTVIEAGAAVGAGARIRRSLLLPGARVGAGSVLDGCVVGFGAEVPPGARVRQRLVCRRTAGGTVPAGSSVVGELVYAPLDPEGAPAGAAERGGAAEDSGGQP
ncbi:MAG TPA: NDP-sugar synthase [Thermoanaerobaculia bacterium]|nr:NDP-sugar synthase [Thermoanaerobaculia bacterium]